MNSHGFGWGLGGPLGAGHAAVDSIVVATLDCPCIVKVDPAFLVIPHLPLTSCFVTSAHPQ